MSEEIWKPVTGFEAFYDVSSHGRLRRKLRKRGDHKRILKTQLVHGYPHCTMSAEGKRVGAHIHRLVAREFIGPPPEGLQVAHLDGSRDNNHVENLVYATPKENTSHKRQHGTWLVGERCYMSMIKENEALYLKFCSRVLGEKRDDLAKRVGIHYRQLGGHLKNWRYLDPIIDAAVAVRERLTLEDAERNGLRMLPAEASL